MKPLLKKVFLFISFTMLVIGIINYILDKSINEPHNFKISESKNIIMLGHSQAACAYDDSIIDNFENCASTMEGYFYTFYKLKKILEANPQITTVFVECTNNQFMKFAENRIWGEYMPSLLPKYFPIIDVKGVLFLAKKSPMNVLKAYSVSQKIKVNYFIYNKDENYLKKHNIVGYIKRIGHLKKEKVDSIIAQNRKISNKSKSGSYLIENVNYLKEIVKLCNDKKVTIYFIRSPMPSYSKFSNDSLFHDILDKQFSKVPFVDLKDYPLELTDFNDNMHLNYTGANKVSFFMNELLKTKSLGNDTLQKWIDYKINKLDTVSD